MPAGVLEKRPRVPAGARVYAIGDIHGRLDLLLRLHDMIRRDAETSGAARRIVVYLGEYMMWIRKEFLVAEDDFGKMVVHGRSIVSEPEIKPNRIGIDTGAFRSDCLTCLVLDGATRRFLDTSGPT